MSKDKVPVYYHDQDAVWELPGRGIKTRAEARQLKAMGLGAFFESGRKFRLHENKPVPVTAEEKFNFTPPIVEGRNSCRRVGEGADGYRVKHFSYPIPAWGARNRPMHVAVINQVPAAELLATGTRVQVQA